MLMLISVADEHRVALAESLNGLRSQGFELADPGPTEQSSAQNFVGWHSYQIDVRGADHEGIIHEVAHRLAKQGASVETIDTGTEDAPFGGLRLFTMTATVLAPPGLSWPLCRTSWTMIGDKLNVDITVEALSD